MARGRRGVELPPLRLIVAPFVGFGADVRVPCGPGLTAVMAAEASVAGHSSVAFGFEPTRAPWLRLELAPTPQLSVRLPVARVSDSKFVYGGAVARFSAALFSRLRSAAAAAAAPPSPSPAAASSPAPWEVGEVPPPPSGKLSNSPRRPAQINGTSALPTHAQSRRKLLSTAASQIAAAITIAPSLELQQRMGLYEAALSPRDRAAIRDALRNVGARRTAERARAEARRDAMRETFDPPGAPSLDPRVLEAPRRSVRDRVQLNRRARELARKNKIEIPGHFEEEAGGVGEAGAGPGFVAPGAAWVPRFLLGETRVVAESAALGAGVRW